MSKILSILLVLSFAGIASAQETYSVTLPASQVAQLDLGRQQTNAANCAKGNLGPTCTQQQLCTALSVGTPGACTAGEANAAGIRLYNNNLNAREAFIVLELVRPPLASYVQKQSELAMAELRRSCLAANQTQKDAICTGIGQSAGCGLCDAFQ